MIKKAILSVPIAISVFLTCSCSDSNKTIADEINRDTTLVIGFLENADKKDLSALVPQNGTFGAEVYFNAGYKEGDEQYVRYTITAYPDYSDKGRYATNIVCTDPNIKFFGGNTLYDCGGLFSYLSERGFEFFFTDDYPSSETCAFKDNITVTLVHGKNIAFNYEVENRNKIQF